MEALKNLRPETDGLSRDLNVFRRALGSLITSLAAGFESEGSRGSRQVPERLSSLDA